MAKSNSNGYDIFTEIKRKASLCDEIEIRGVSLSKLGFEKMRAVCPFHPDKDPSFVVYLESEANEYENYHCFGCQEHGDVIDFVMKYDKVDIQSALMYFSKKYNISFLGLDNLKTILKESPQKRSTASLFPFMLEVSDMVRDFLKKSKDPQKGVHRLQEYLKKIDEAVYIKDKSSLNMFRKMLKKLLINLKEKNGIENKKDK